MKELQIYEMVNCPMRGRHTTVGQCIAGCPYHRIGVTKNSRSILCTYDERGD